MLKRVFDILRPYGDIIIFMLTLLVSNYFWKYTMLGEASGVGAVTWFGIDLTHVFNAYAAYIADRVYTLISLCRDTLYQVDAYTIRWLTGSGTRIVWSCTPLKQAFIWICIMLATPGLWHRPFSYRELAKRLAWIVCGLVIIHGFNILRISIITLFMEHHADWFEVLHTYIFKYIFYGIMFLLWVIYVEKIRPGQSPYRTGTESL